MQTQIVGLVLKGQTAPCAGLVGLQVSAFWVFVVSLCTLAHRIPASRTTNECEKRRQRSRTALRLRSLNLGSIVLNCRVCLQLQQQPMERYEEEQDGEYHEDEEEKQDLLGSFAQFPRAQHGMITEHALNHIRER